MQGLGCAEEILDKFDFSVEDKGIAIDFTACYLCVNTQARQITDSLKGSVEKCTRKFYLL